MRVFRICHQIWTIVSLSAGKELLFAADVMPIAPEYSICQLSEICPSIVTRIFGAIYKRPSRNCYQI